MKWAVLTGGEYGEYPPYIKVIKTCDKIVAVDGGANFAYQAGIWPDYLIGDMDSVEPEVYRLMEARGVDIHRYPPAKDFTDTHLALTLAENRKASEVVIMGWIGDRFDHTLATLYCGVGLAQRGIRITYIAPGFTAYLLKEELKLKGTRGDTVSLVALSEKVEGVYLEGFQYPLIEATLTYENPIGISNLMLGETANIRVRKGIAAVIHFPGASAID